MDYKELIDVLRNQEPRVVLEYIEDAAAIETLLEERDAAVEDLKKICEDNPDVCQYCKHMPCGLYRTGKL